MNDFNVYKGLQKPLVFKGFKGKYIYLGGGVIIFSMVVFAITSSFVSFLVGGISLVFVMCGGLFFIAIQQKKGLYSKKKHKGIFIVSRIFKR